MSSVISILHGDVFKLSIGPSKESKKRMGKKKKPFISMEMDRHDCVHERSDHRCKVIMLAKLKVNKKKIVGTYNSVNAILLLVS